MSAPVTKTFLLLVLVMLFLLVFEMFRYLFSLIRKADGKTENLPPTASRVRLKLETRNSLLVSPVGIRQPSTSVVTTVSRLYVGEMLQS